MDGWGRDSRVKVNPLHSVDASHGLLQQHHAVRYLIFTFSNSCTISPNDFSLASRNVDYTSSESTLATSSRRLSQRKGSIDRFYSQGESSNPEIEEIPKLGTRVK